MPVVPLTIPETHHATAPVKEPQRLAINEGIRKLAEERENVTLCDLAKALLGPGGSFDAGNFGPDKLHLGAAGYERWAAALQPIFVELKVEAKYGRFAIVEELQVSRGAGHYKTTRSPVPLYVPARISALWATCVLAARTSSVLLS